VNWHEQSQDHPTKESYSKDQISTTASERCQFTYVVEGKRPGKIKEGGGLKNGLIKQKRWVQGTIEEIKTTVHFVKTEERSGCQTQSTNRTSKSGRNRRRVNKKKETMGNRKKGKALIILYRDGGGRGRGGNLRG